MRKLLGLTAAAVIAGLVPPALADEGMKSPQQQVVTADDIRSQLEALGYDVRRLRTRDGTFKVYMVERRSGGAVKATFGAATGELVRARLAS